MSTSVQADLCTLDRLATSLPFHLDDAAQVNALFVSEATSPDPHTRYLIEVWTYLHVRRYFLVKHACEPFRPVSDLDALVAGVFQRIDRHHAGVRQRDRYTHWVNKVCKNAYLSYVRRRRDVRSVEEMQAQYGFEQSEAVPYAAQADGASLRAAVQRVIRTLPPFLRTPIRLYLMDEYTYAEIAEAIGKGTPTVRVYISRALKVLRGHPDLLCFTD
ncbi:MAG: sigma-70 family RNA polymerase sigma factor [Bacteroidota bacterium]